MIEQDDTGRHLFELGALRVVGILRRGDQQAKDKCGYRPDQARPQPDHILCIRAQMVLRQRAAEQHTNQDTARDAHKRDAR